MPESSTVSTLHHLKVSLDGVYPTIWRRLAVPGTTTLADLHMILQIALGWEGYHHHEFHVLFDASVGMDDLVGSLVQGQAAERATLKEIAGSEGARLRYVYDLGDYWEHTIVVERLGRLAPKPNANSNSNSNINYPRCLAGARAVPPEDCGGPENYMAMLRRRQSRLSRQSRQTRQTRQTGQTGQTGQSGKSPRTGASQRTGRSAGFDPTAFDRDEINQQLSNWQRSATESPARSDEMSEPDDL